MNSKKIFVFDFCGTLVSKQTADLFVSYVLKKQGNYSAYLYSLFLRKFQRNKKFDLLKLLKGSKKQDLEYLAISYANYLKDYKILKVYERIKKILKQKGTKVYVISAGYSIYIKQFFKNYDVEVISNDFKYTKDLFDGEICLDDCFGENKLKRFKETLNEKDIDKNFIIDECYSDSFTDEPIFQISEKKFFVKDNNIMNKDDL